jgi:TPP-dependent pyruvate/acetoin dehydrogenase alpha subunit
MALPAKQSPESPFLSADRLREMYGMMLRIHFAQDDLHPLFKPGKWPGSALPPLDHPAVLAGCFMHLRAGDAVSPAVQSFAANLAAGAGVDATLRNLAAQAASKIAPAKADGATGLAMLAGFALAHQTARNGQILVAFVREKDLLSANAAAVLHQCHRQQLPLIFLTISNKLPSPGQSQNHHGVPQIAVAADDVVAIYRVMQESAHRARTGIGPTWIHCSTATIPRHAALSATALRTMEHFLETRGLFDKKQRRREQERWSKEWRLALKKLRSKTEMAETPLLISCIDLCR